MCDSGTNLMRLRHGPDGEPGKDPNGEQGEDQDETEEDLNETFPNCDRHSRDDPLRLPNIHGRAATIDTVNGHVLLVVNEEPLHLPPARGGDQAGCSTTFTLPGGCEERSHQTPRCCFLSSGKHGSQSSHKVKAPMTRIPLGF